MMTRIKGYASLMAICMLAVVYPGCKKNWAGHNDITDSHLRNNLYQAISQTANLGKFSDMLVKSGYDKIISSSKTYTVWVPTDQALQSLDPAIVNDTARLKQFVANHIANQVYTTGIDQRIAMLNGKYNIMSGNKFDSAGIITANQYASNGVFHIIDKFIPRYDNCWEFVKNTLLVPLNKAFLLSLNYNFFDSTQAVQTGIDPATGKPVYQQGTGIVLRNSFLERVMNINDESNQYTVFLLTDNAYTTELNKLTPWFKTSSTDSTTALSGFHLVKDFAFKGMYTVSQLPAAGFTSKDGINVKIDPSDVIGSYKTSNGIVHIINSVDTGLMRKKFPTLYIQGENPNAFQIDRSANTFYRVRYDSTSGTVYNDILMQNYNVASYYINYLVRNINSMRYNAYWRAINDVQTTPLWQQRLSFDSARNVNFPYVTVAYRNFNEVYLGQMTINNYRNLNLYVVGPSTASSTGGANSISLDYIKLVPAF